MGGRSRSSGSFSGLSEPPKDQGIHVYLFWTKDGKKYLSHTTGEVTAEQLCISAAETIGITALCHSLFALYNPERHFWYSPNHIFKAEENPSLVLRYCMRYYFRNWHGLNENEPMMCRYPPKSGSKRGFPLLDTTSLEYLFSQAKYEFVNEVVQMEDVKTEEEQTRFKNESLGMAVLHLSYQAIKTESTLQDVASKVSFLDCVPRSFAKHISRDNFLTKLRIQRVFKDFVRSFQQHTVDRGNLCTEEIMYKYIATLEHLAPRFGTETFPVTRLDLRDEDDRSGSCSSTTHAQCGSKDNFCGPISHEISVSGTEGIQWRKVSAQRAQANNYMGNGYINYMRKPKQHSSQPDADTPNDWTFFSEFPEITHIAITDSNVCISTRDNLCMEVQMISSQEAHSFVSLLDGYYRLTADAHHYLCHEVAPPRVVWSEANLLHGPMHDEFVLSKLKKEAEDEGTFLARWSVVDYSCIILAVLIKNQDGVTRSHKQFRVHVKDSMLFLEGLERQFPSMKELTDSLKSFVLKSGSDSFTVKKCCSPKSGELSNLLVRRHNECDVHAEPLSQTYKTRLMFPQIKDKDIKQEQHLGRGTRTNIYSGRLLTQEREESDNDEFNNNSHRGHRVVLKILDQTHEDIALVFFETASLMCQVSHRHLVFVYGVSVKGSENIMVEEFVDFGPLDVFLRREKNVSAGWKFIVAKQLASALDYLETNGLVHGNVCAKNILLVKNGLEPNTTPFIKLSDPGIALSVLSREERLERIPWIAPECIDSGSNIGSHADQWSFGVTMLEIYNNGDLPFNFNTLSEKERFYQQKGHLAEPSSPELARFINMCLTYEPEERPSFRKVHRELVELMRKGFVIQSVMPSSEASANTDPTVFHKRYLKQVRILGEGHFGKVTLYLYDPANDGKGEQVAVKSLKQENDKISDGWMKEIEILKSLYHSNIVKYKGCCTELGGQVVQLIMEYLPLGSLKDYLPKRNLPLSHCLMFAQQICQGMNYLHSKRYVHRDLAARNVLVENDSLVKIGDFGLTKYIPEGEIYYRVREDGDSPVFWYAIECLKESKFSFSSDVWSFGVTLYEILTRCDRRQSPPDKFFEMMKEAQGQMTVVILIKLLEQGLRLPCPKDSPHEVKILMERCWSADPSERPDFESLIKKFQSLRQAYWQSFS
ncbi:non-receptor tyrosine-protein kinase TYK2 [Pundamilia nyererei]|uniref:Tyrosine-protein kinase n=1 Tax=Pundamilia nyererei TaxID=303518 RepID=A0A3B4G7L1_9CICH|nr:PREDICTED: non-receptor tyrosine-protein kinase TYK2 [Pundamilia nyererei]